MHNIDAVKRKIEELKEEIRKHEYHYYVLNSPLITDKEFDDLVNELKTLEQKYPQFITSDSPTQRVGGTFSNEFKKVVHNPPMLSLDNCYNEKEFINWYNRIKKQLNHFEMVVEAKIDGLSCAIVYEDGILTKASTRGDGKIGEDVTANVKTIKSIPLKINLLQKTTLEIRGEVYINKDDFELINKKQIENGEEPFANPRNAASGSLRQKDPLITSSRKLRFLAHSYGDMKNIKDLKSQWEFLDFCNNIRIPVNPLRKLCRNIDEVIDFYRDIEKKREKLDFEIDGIVVKVNSFEYQRKLGFTSKSPRWAIAFKFKAHQVKTKLLDVIFSVGRTGIVTPVAKLIPVECGGVTISNSTLHNFDEIKRLNLKIGDQVIVERAGDVIPKIVRAVIEERDGTQKDIKIPEKCPSCSSNLVREEDEVYVRCINPNCPDQILRTLIHFTSRNAMNIEGLGKNIIEELIKMRFVEKITDIYKLTKNELLQLPLFKEKKATNILNQIEKSKKQNLNNLIYALGIRHIGQKNAKILAQNYKDIENLLKANEAELSNISEIGPIISKSIINFFKNPNTQKLIEELKKYGVNTKYIETKESKLRGLTFVFTGEMKSMSRSVAKEKVVELGGNVSNSISKNISYVVVGENPGSKYNKAVELKLNIINEEEFLKIIS